MTTPRDIKTHSVWSWVISGSTWMQVDEGTRDEMIVSLRRRREAASRVMPGGSRFVMTRPGQEPQTAWELDPEADMPPPVRAEPPSAPGPWEPGYRLTDAEAAEVLRASADHELISALRAQVASLASQLDFYLGRNVIHVMERNAEEVMPGLVSEVEGTLLRATDTGREWELRSGQWTAR